MTVGVETELKFQVPPAAREGVRAALAAGQTLPLRAAYADTADSRLADAGMALRLRREGRRWVQTLKGRGDGPIDRLEHNVVLAPARGQPLIDPARHAGTPAGDKLAALLADGAALVERYRVVVSRTLRRVRSGGATVEIAFDEGRIVAGARRVAVCELEFELVAGSRQGLFALAARWAKRHGLWLDVRTKSERGHRLAEGLAAVPARKAMPIAWAAPPTPAGAFAAMLHNTLDHLLPNAAEIGAGSGDAETLHQLRVALRRLRTALRLFGAWSADPAAAADLQTRWSAPFARLGAARDADVLAALPDIALPAPTAAAAPEDPGVVVREAAFGVLAIDTLALAQAALPALEGSLAEAAPAVLAEAWRGVAKGARNFTTDPPERRHRTRRRLKRLRYATEFLRPLLPAKPTDRALAAMRDALDALGDYNDVLVAEGRCRALDGGDPKVAYALGWLAARHRELEAKAARLLARLTRHKRFWR